MVFSGALSWLGLGDSTRATARKLYGTVVAAARQPIIYTSCGVPDTAEGRYEIVVLHLFLVLERLNAAADPARSLVQPLIEAFITDMDDCMREMGVGDLTVPKKVKRAAAGLYERSAAYRTALAPGALSSSLAEVLAASIPGLGRADELAAYARVAAAHLKAAPAAPMAEGRLSFPPFEHREMT